MWIQFFRSIRYTFKGSVSFTIYLQCSSGDVHSCPLEIVVVGSPLDSLSSVCKWCQLVTKVFGTVQESVRGCRINKICFDWTLLPTPHVRWLTEEVLEQRWRFSVGHWEIEGYTDESKNDDGNWSREPIYHTFRSVVLRETTVLRPPE